MYAANFCELPPCDGIPARTFSGKVIAVLDGDTLLVMRAGKPVKVRLAEVDAPEKAQPYGTAAQKSLAEMVMGKQIQVASRAVDDYGRMVATVNIDGLNVNHEQVRLGMAWAAVGWRQSRPSLRDPLHSNRELMALQREAQQARRGLWAEEEAAVEPSQWRRQHPGTLSAPPHAAVSQASAPAAATSLDPACDSKKHCSEMSSCEEARHYLTRCGVKTLDGDGDGAPCEKLCVVRQGRDLTNHLPIVF
ncbi:MAG: hypothetical protein A3K04_09710 [Gallionellales bacterium RBG_16_56_9]|nr:MAG: hypothetical protein A3K04_09710 [Gallionellales bacterium RBG_16_56_9]